VVEHRLVEELKILATIAAKARLDSETDPAKPGYIRVNSNGRRLYFPVHVTSDLPDRLLLGGLLKFVDRIRIASAQSTLCLSGSALFGGSVALLGDVDFCEYLNVANGSDVGQMLRDKLAVDDPDLACLKLGCFDPDGGGGAPLPEMQRPFEFPEYDARHWGARESWMLDFAIDLGGDALEATNLGLRLGSAPDILDRSFAQQEAPIDIELYPKTYASLAELERYLSFLVQQVKLQLEKGKAVKALKRGLALCRLLGFRDLGDEFAELLRHGVPVHEEAAKVRYDFAWRLEQLNDPALYAFIRQARDVARRIEKLVEQRRHGRSALIASESFFERASNALGLLLDYCDDAGL